MASKKYIVAQTKENIKVSDGRGFIYEVEVQHNPDHGFSTAYYLGGIIGQVELGKIHTPISDDDAEWERFEELFGEWKDEIMINMKLICKNYFDAQ